MPLPDQHFGLWLGIESGMKSPKNANFYMKWFCTFFCTHEAIFPGFAHLQWRVYFHHMHDGACIFTPYKVVCVFSFPLVWCVYFHTCMIVCVFSCPSVWCVYFHACMSMCVFLQCWWSVYSQALLKLFWFKAAFLIHSFIWRNKSSDQKKMYPQWFELTIL